MSIHLSKCHIVGNHMSRLKDYEIYYRLLMKFYHIGEIIDEQ